MQKDNEEYKEYISKAITWARKANINEIKTEAELFNFLKRIDK